MHQEVAKAVLQHDMWRTSASGARTDQRGGNSTGWKTIRPIRLQVPALPEVVHGSALFAKGDTQVLSTATIAPPREGLSIRNYPFSQQQQQSPNHKPDLFVDSLPVGSLRFLRTQETILSDFNSRRVQVDKERTGDSGSWVDIQRVWLQYDFPGYATGAVPTGKPDRRAMGHGVLVERALQSVVPVVEDFPYCVWLTTFTLLPHRSGTS
jgi:polyribonucleotide nucleotidyltransferase